MHPFDRALEVLAAAPSVSRFLQTVCGVGNNNTAVSNVYGSLPAVLLRLITRSQPVLVVLPTERDARSMEQDLSALDVSAKIFPWWGTVPYHEAGPASTVFGVRAALLSALSISNAAGQQPVILASQRAFLSPLPPPAYMHENVLALHKGDTVDPQKIAAKLAEWGWTRVNRVQLKHEFVLRGEVLDVLPSGEDFAYRILFDFNTIESIKQFDTEDQGGKRDTDVCLLFPLKEVVWTDDRIETLYRNLCECDEIKQYDVNVIIDTLITKKTLIGEEELFPLAFETRSSLLDYFGTPLAEEPLTIFIERERLDNASDALNREAQNLYLNAKSVRPVPRPERIFFEWEALSAQCKNSISFVNIDVPNKYTLKIDMPVQPPQSYFGNINFLKEELTRLVTEGWHITLAAETDAQAARISSILHIQESDAQVSDLTAVKTFPLSQGFAFTECKEIIITENEIFGRKEKKPRSLSKARSAAIDTFVELNPGDYIVHVNYGIGLFQGIDRIKALSNERDYIKLLYDDDEFIFVPIEQVNLIQRYIGNEGDAPKLDKLGGKAWNARKARARAAAEELAKKLLALYAKRKAQAGFAFPPDSEWQAMFEAAFPYEETPDQLRCIEEIKADMESPSPMDRLVCGDVGYGKTEIAVRACFKAVMGGKQAAFLAPTTILAEQHFQTMKERFAQFPVRIAMLSRFVKPKEIRESLKKIADGEIDIVLGTHRIIQKDVQFKNLGFMVIDEEQRFGVKDKERLKELKHNIDCLSLSATPIPRTLHVSLLKIRDMSILATAPRNRHPIQTVIEEFNDRHIAQAVRTEVERGGQVFYLHNRIETLDDTRLRLQRLLPEMLCETAHGKMNADELEDVMRRFIHGGFHILVSTTIIENGIDIPNVNTIIIDRADMYGVSQLYQLRGRVGRSDRIAYAYLFYPDTRSLSETAMKRLQAISDFTELGSGFKIALKDMEIRGAGNLLGREQSGNIYSVGFDMYTRLLDEAIAKLQNEDYEAEDAVLLELEYSGYIPDSYISTAQEKMELYKKIAAVKTAPELDALALEITDRFGPPPKEAASLFALAEIRIICRELSVLRLKEKDGRARITFNTADRINVDALLRLIKTSGGAVRLDSQAPNEIILNTGKIGLEEKAFYIRETLEKLAKR
ncbi:MAG: transcription-repair coupling factor [Spirochaetaceae bacterium]|jgi:transcription-repair coupling factor (superfamily II helicase)|nr:transcription-repair coupling factor [Spirochaetaceae bacterium]